MASDYHDGEASEVSYKDVEIRALKKVIRELREQFAYIAKTANNLTVVDVAIKALKIRAEGWE